jgi:hypothetical protein
MSRVPSSMARAAMLLLVLWGVAAGPALATADVGSVTFTLGQKRMTAKLLEPLPDEPLREGEIIPPFWYLSAPHTGAAGDTVPPGSPLQPALGIETSWGREGWPVQIAFDILHSYDDGLQRFPAISLGSLVIPPADVRRRARTVEIGLGARRSWQVKGFSPYVGAGGAWIWTTVDYQMSDPSQGQFGAPVTHVGGQDSAPGFWAGGGLFRPIGRRFQIGIAGRYSKATVTLPRSTVEGQQGGYRFTGRDTQVEAGGTHVGLVVGWAYPARK